MASFRIASRLAFVAFVAAVALVIAHDPSLGQEAAATGKLVVTKAMYGDLPDGQKTDVTEKVRGMVKDDALSVEATNENFGDPVEGVVKKLTVEYTFAGQAKSKTVNEGETLAISNTGD